MKDWNKLFIYKSGYLYWRVKANRRIRIGDLAGCAGNDGRRVTKVNYKQFLASRIIFAMHHGVMPKNVDHVNGKMGDDRIENLRAATPRQNSWNMKRPITNKSGVKGIYWAKNRRKWSAQLYIGGKPTFLGHYRSLKKATAVVRAARLKHHGEFARHV